MTNTQAVVYFLVKNKGQTCTNKQIAEATGRPLSGISVGSITSKAEIRSLATSNSLSPRS